MLTPSRNGNDLFRIHRARGGIGSHPHCFTLPSPLGHDQPSRHISTLLRRCSCTIIAATGRNAIIGRPASHIDTRPPIPALHSFTLMYGCPRHLPLVAARPGSFQYSRLKTANMSNIVVC